MSFAGSASDISSLVSIITTATSSIESFYRNSSKKPVPTLDNVDPHPLDVSIYPLEGKHSVQMLEGACTQLCATLSRPNHTMLSRYLKLFEPACLGVVLHAYIADILLDKPSGLFVSEISNHCSIEPRKLSQVLRILCSTHIFHEVTNNVFANNRLSMQLMSSTPLWSAGVHLVDKPVGKAALHLVDTLLDPEWGFSYAAEHTCFNCATGYPHPLYIFFEDKDNEKAAEQGTRFGKAMVRWNETADAGAIITEYPWGNLSPGSVVNDLGGGVGHITMQLHKLYPTLNLKLQDLSERI
ncbi:hypothetical protein Ac2012v2_001230 [Leucoagaricus gongylophorus]